MEWTLQDILSALGPSAADAALMPRNAALDQQRIQNEALKMQILQDREAQQQQLRAAQLQGTQARAQIAQAKAQPRPDSLTTIQAILGGQDGPTASPGGGGNQYSIEGDTRTPFDMNRANERVRGILAALSQGQAPQAGPNLPRMTATSLSPETGQDTSRTFALQGYGGQIGFNPQTGAFTNVGLPGQEKAASAQPTQVDSAGKRAALAAQLKGKIPEAEITKLLDTQFPETNKAMPIEKLSKLFRYNPDTQGFEAAPSNLTDAQAQAQGFRTYDEKTRNAVNELKDVNIAFQQLRSAVNDIQGKSALGLKASELTGGNIGGPEGAVFKKASTNFTTIFDKFLGGVRGAGSPQMQAIRSKVLPSIISSPEVSDKLMGDLEDLINQMSDSRIRAAIGDQPNVNMKAINQKAEQVLRTFNGKGQASTTQPPSSPAGQKSLDQGTAAKFLNQAGGDKDRARALAKAAGYSF